MGSLIGAAVLLATTSLTFAPTTTLPHAPISQIVSFVADEYGVSSSTLSNLASSTPNLLSSADPLALLDIAAQNIAEGKDYANLACNCYAFVKAKLGTIPLMGAIQPNIGKPDVGDVAIFYYPSKETGQLVKHIAYVSSVGQSSFTIEESNKTHCLVDSRVILNSDYLVGFWAPNMT